MKTITIMTALVAILGLGAWGLGTAQEEGATPAQVLERFRAEHPDLPVVNVSRTPVPGLFALELQGMRIIYGTADARHLLTGNLLAFEGEELVSLTEQALEKRSEELKPVRKRLIEGVPVEQMVVFPPSGPTRASVTVFTDVECGFCQRLHQEVPKLNEMGVEVRYLAYPAQGQSAYRKIAGAWCSADPRSTLDELLNTPRPEQSVAAADCEHPVDDHFALGQQLAVQGTPAIVLEDGSLVGGYVPAEELGAALGL